MTRQQNSGAAIDQQAAPPLTVAAIPPTDVLRQVALLREASTADLKQRWRGLFGQEPPPFSRSYLQSRLAYRVQELEPRRRARSWDDKMAEAVAFLVSAHATLEGLSGEAYRDPQADRMLASVSGKVFEALCTLDDFNVTRWIESGSLAPTSYSLAHLPSWWVCVDR